MAIRAEPALAVLSELAREHAIVPVWIELAADLDTPVTAFLKLRRRHAARFLLESVEGGERVGRYSFIGCGERRRLRVAADGDPWKALGLIARDRVAGGQFGDLPGFWGGYVGWIGFDAVRHLEPTVGKPPPDDLGMPAAEFIEPEVLVAFDHVKHRMLLIRAVPAGEDLPRRYVEASAALRDVASALAAPLEGQQLQISAEPAVPPYRSTLTRQEFMDRVATCLEHIRAGDVFQIVPSQRFSVSYDGDPFLLYRHLRILNPSPYMFFQDWGDYQLVGSSPEVMVRLDGDVATVRPIAGTRRRGGRPDDEIAAELLADEKECAEHIMLVDLGRNDLGRVCAIGSVRVDSLMHIEKYSHVLHIVSNVTGRLAPGRTGLDLLAASFPAGTLSGAPKIKALELLNKLEPRRRGPYGGAVGTLAYDGAVNMGITIRTLLVKAGQAHVQAGAGVVADSDPALEHQECLNKAHALLLAVGAASAGKGQEP
ncbi:MAG: chorismate-binding protein [Candidatus Sericytochromatia bacterium]|nr:chorismate-binding protein [Candidatus Tanganyikabacteria bacterium]